MNLPISPAGTILTAVRSVTRVARDIQTAVGFDKLLQDGQPETADLPSLLEKTVAAIRDSLSRAGIAVNPPIRFSVQDSGRLQVARDESGRDHPRAAEIELLLHSNDELSRLAKRLQAAGGPDELTIGGEPAVESGLPPGSGLTGVAELDNITGSSAGQSGPGGYANW